MTEVHGNEKRMRPMENNSNILSYVNDQKLFDILLNIYLSIDHSSKERMMCKLKKKQNFIQSNFKTILNVCYVILFEKQKSKKNNVL